MNGEEKEMSDLVLHLNGENYSSVKKILRVLGGNTRADILRIISDGRDWTIQDIAKKTTTKLPNVSQQISELERAGLVVKRFSKIRGNNTRIIKPIYKRIVINIGK